MANSPSSKKRALQSERRAAINKARRSRIRTFIRKVEEAIASGDIGAAAEALRQAQPEIMRGVSKGVLHKNTASRKISRLAGRVNAQVTPRGSGAAAMVAAGEADLGLLPVSEILNASGVDFAGVIAEEIQLHQIFASAVVAGSKQMEAGKRLIAFLASADAATTIRRFGMEPCAT